MNNCEKNEWEQEFLHHIPDLPLIGKWADDFNVNNYMNWFEKININTFIWQMIVVVLLIVYHKEIKIFLKVIINKISDLVSLNLNGMHFENSRKINMGVQKLINEKGYRDTSLNLILKTPKPSIYKENSNNKLKKKLYDLLDKEFETYKSDLQKNPNTAFLNAFVEIESLLFKLYSKTIPTRKQGFSQGSARIMFYQLVETEIITPTITEMFNISLRLRNSIVHGKKPLRTADEAEIYLKALVIIKHEIMAAIEKYEADREDN